MKLWGIFAALVVVGVVVIGAFYVSGAFSNSVDQGGDGPIIAYVHPSATIQINNGDTMSEYIGVTIVGANAVVDQNAPSATNIFSLWNAKDCNERVTFTINGVGTITEEYTWHVAAMETKDFSAETVKAFGMKATGTYTITVQVSDIINGNVRDTYQFSVVVA
jgi:hypothetical protein